MAPCRVPHVFENCLFLINPKLGTPQREWAAGIRDRNCVGFAMSREREFPPLPKAGKWGTSIREYSCEIKGGAPSRC